MIASVSLIESMIIFERIKEFYLFIYFFDKCPQIFALEFCTLTFFFPSILRKQKLINCKTKI